MRIAQLFRILVALLHLTLYSTPTTSRLIHNSSYVHQQHHHHQQQHHHHRHHQKNPNRFHHHANSTWWEFGRWLSPPEAQLFLRQEAGDPAKGVDCCPSVMEMVQPKGGKNMDGIYVELYGDGSNSQRFYEVSCRPEVEGKPCRFMDKKLHNQSRCEQKFSYTYALVKETPELRHSHHQPHSSPTYFPTLPGRGPGGHSWMMDYIQVRSGCGCVLYPKPKPMKKTIRNRPTRRPHQQHTTVADESEPDIDTDVLQT